MQARIGRTVFLTLLIVLGAFVPGQHSPIAPAWAGETGELKLMVTCCAGSSLDNAQVEVVIYRGGLGQVDSGSGYTDNGYIEFEFNDLEADDQARVTVTPSGEAESSHVYYWIGGDGAGEWDLGLNFGGCPDVWFDKAQNIIQCKCDID